MLPGWEGGNAGTKKKWETSVRFSGADAVSQSKVPTFSVTHREGENKDENWGIFGIVGGRRAGHIGAEGFGPFDDDFESRR